MLHNFCLVVNNSKIESSKPNSKYKYLKHAQQNHSGPFFQRKQNITFQSVEFLVWNRLFRLVWAFV